MRTFKKLKLPAVLLMTFPMAACATNIAGIDTGCRSFKPIIWSKIDSTKTQRQVVKHNAAYDAICKG